MSATRIIAKRLKDLSSPDPARRRAAVEDLARGDERAVYPLIKALRDENPGVQDAAIRSLAAIGGEVTAYMVLPLLREGPFLRNAALLILKEIGPGIVPLLHPLFKDRDDDIRKFAIDLLCEVNRCDEPATLAAMISADPNPNVRAAAARTAGQLGIREALPQLKAALGDEEWVRFHALEAIAALGDEEAVEAIVPLLASSSDATRFAAIDGLGSVGSAPAGQALLAHLGRVSGHEKFLVLKNLIRAGVPLPVDGTSAVLLEALRTGEWEDRLAALRGLAELKDESAVFPIIDTAGLLDPAEPGNDDILAAVREALAAFDRPDAILRALSDPAVRYRGKVVAAEVAGDLTLGPAVPALLGLLETDLRDVRRASAAALARIGGPGARDALATALGDRDGHVRKTAAAALGSWRDREAFDLMAARLREETYPDVREALVLALIAVDRDAFVARLDAYGEEVRALAGAFAGEGG